MKQLRAEGVQKLAEALQEDCRHLERLSRDDPGIGERANQASGWLGQIVNRINEVHLKEGENEDA
jgi:hypothetical protein